MSDHHEAYDEANETIDTILDVNPVHPEAWAYRAVIAHLRVGVGSGRGGQANDDAERGDQGDGEDFTLV